MVSAPARRQQAAHAFLWLPLIVRAGACAVCWALVMVFNSGGAKTFIYFQF